VVQSFIYFILFYIFYLFLEIKIPHLETIFLKCYFLKYFSNNDGFSFFFKWANFQKEKISIKLG